MTGTKDTAKKVDNSASLERAIRIGLVAYGVVHLLIAWLALQLAFGHSSGSPSQQGAMQELAQKSYGTVLLWVVGLGLAALVVWQSFDALWGHQKHDGAKRTFKRVGSAGKAVVYVGLAASAIKQAVGAASSSKSHLTKQVMELPLGQVIVGTAGVITIGIGGYLISRAVRRSYEQDLQPQATSSGSTAAVVGGLARAGYTAKGVSLGVIGALFIWAAATYDPAKAGGLDAALRTVLDQSFGRWLVGAVGLGLGCFGVYCFWWARYADTSS